MLRWGIFSPSIEELRLRLILKSHVVHNSVSFSYWGPTSGSHILSVMGTSNSGFLPWGLKRAPSRSPTLGQRRVPGWEEVSQRLGQRSRPRQPSAGRREAGAGLRLATGGFHLPRPARPGLPPTRRGGDGGWQGPPRRPLPRVGPISPVAARSSLAESREPGAGSRGRAGNLATGGAAPPGASASVAGGLRGAAAERETGRPRQRRRPVAKKAEAPRGAGSGDLNSGGSAPRTRWSGAQPPSRLPLDRL